MKFFNHTIYASTKIDRHEKTSALSVPSVVDTYQYSYRVNIYSGSESAWTLEKQTTFTYNGWNLIEEVEASVYDSNNSAFTQFRTSNYVWGLDLSQTIQGAGGVSGLLSLDKGTATYYYTYDANGNGLEEALYKGFAFELIDTAGVVKAHYEYSPFGKVVYKSGLMKDENPFKFSTKYLDNETQLYYYGLRYYNPENGRWINRDPLAEDGGLNIYQSVDNSSTNHFDILGLNKRKNCINTSRTIDVNVPGKRIPIGAIGPIPVTANVGFSFNGSLGLETCDECCENEGWKSVTEYELGVTFGGSASLTFGINESWKSDGYKTSGFLGIRFSAKAESSVLTTWIKGGCSTNPSNKVCFNTNLSGAVTGGGSLTVQWPWWSWSGGATVTGSGGIGCEICGTFDDDGKFTMGSLKCKPKKFSVKGQVCVGVCIDFTII